MSATTQRELETPAKEAISAAPDNTAFAELYERYFPELYDFVVRTMGEMERARDRGRGAKHSDIRSGPVDGVSRARSAGHAHRDWKRRRLYR